MAQKTEMAITSLKINHFYLNFDHKRVWKSSQMTEIDRNPPMTDPTQNTDYMSMAPGQSPAYMYVKVIRVQDDDRNLL